MSSHQRTRRRLSAALLAAPLCAPARANAAPLRLGLVPYLTARQMINVFDPLRAHLQATLDRPVMSFTAASLRALAVNTQRGDYDLAFMPVHFMRLAEQAWGYSIVARTSSPTDIVLAAAPGRRLDVPTGLRGGRVVSLDELAITSMVTLQWLREQKLEPGRDLQVEYLTAANSVLLALQRPEVTAIALIEAQLADMAPEMRAMVEVVVRIRTVPSPGYVVSTRLPAAERERVAAALLSFGGAPGGDRSLSRAPLQATRLEDTTEVERYSRQLQALLAR